MTRIISGSVLVVLILAGVIYATPVYFLLGIGFIGIVCLYEYFRLIRAMGIQVQPWPSYILFWLLLIELNYRLWPLPALFAIALMATVLSALWRRQSPRERTLALMAEALGVLYFVLFLYPAIAIRYEFGAKTGLHWMLLLLSVIWIGDTAALVLGKTLGKFPLAPILSPRKTIEGAIGGLLAALGAGIAVQHFLFPDLPLLHAAIVSFLLGIFGQLGDLSESMLKRAAGAKDSSNLIPGHGGAMDRMDSLLFAFPILYFYLSFLYR